MESNSHVVISYKYIHNGRIDKAKEVVAVKIGRTIGDAFRM